MILDACKGYDKLCKETLISKDDINYLKAKSLFMVNDDYSIDEIKKTRNLLLNIFHPDNEGNGSNEKSKIINLYYQILKEEREDENS